MSPQAAPVQAPKGYDAEAAAAKRSPANSAFHSAHDLGVRLHTLRREETRNLKAKAVYAKQNPKSVPLWFFEKYKIITNSLIVQFVLYVIYLGFFAEFKTSMRMKDEVYLTKFLLDNILEEPFNPAYDNDHFMSMANVADVDLFVSNVLIEALLVDQWLDESYKTPKEMSETFDYLDWSTGLKIQQTRVKGRKKTDCLSLETSGMMRWFAEQRYGECKYGQQSDTAIRLPWEAPDTENCAIAQTHLYGDCYSWDVEIDPTDPHVDDVISKDSFGYNWTHHDQPLYEPYVYLSSDELGSNPMGQDSASTTATYNSLPTDGFVAVLIPFFSPVLLPDQEGRSPIEVLDYREFAYNVSRGAAPANFFCLRTSRNGVAVRQICDPNDGENRTTGRVKEEVHKFWLDMKSSRFIDSQTRMLSFTLPVRANHANVKTRLTIMLQLTSLGGVLPSYEFQSRLDTVDYSYMFLLLNLNMALVVFFCVNECLEAYLDGFFTYFTNMWNLMDWAGYCLFLLLYIEWAHLRDSMTDATCMNGAFLCTEVGYYDDWKTMYFTQEVKQYLSMASTLQLLKLLKFINVFIPKMALATSVLSHGLVDLGMFTLFFFFFIFACAQLFFIQLGPYLDSYNNITSAFVTLFRALFGDFDLTAIMDNSSSYTNAILLILYLFAAIFVLLSIFLTILGEHQSHVRDVQHHEKERGSGKEHLSDYGIVAYVGQGVQHSGMRLFSKLYDLANTPNGEEDRRRRNARNAEQQALAMQQWRMALDVLTQGSGVRDAGSTRGPEPDVSPRRPSQEEREHAQAISDEESPRDWREEDPAEGLSPDGHAVGVEMAEYPADMPLLAGAPTTAPYMAREPADASPSSAPTPAMGGIGAVVGAAGLAQGRESPSATGVASTLMLVLEQGKLLRRVLAAQVELAAEQRSIHAAQAELRAELRTELQTTLRTELQSMLVSLQEGTLLAHTPVSGKGEGGGVSDGRGPPLILTTSGHPDPRRRRSPAAKLEGRHGSAKKLLEESSKKPIERPKCGSGFFTRRASNPNGEETDVGGVSSSTAASASPRGSGFFNRRASPQRDAARDADKAKAIVQVEPTALDGTGAVRSDWLSPAELSDGGVLSDGGGLISDGGGKSDGEAKGGRVEIRRRSSSVKTRDPSGMQGHEPLRSEKHRPKGSWSGRTSTSPGRTSATAGAAVHDV